VNVSRRKPDRWTNKSSYRFLPSPCVNLPSFRSRAARDGIYIPLNSAAVKFRAETASRVFIRIPSMPSVVVTAGIYFSWDKNTRNRATSAPAKARKR